MLAYTLYIGDLVDHAPLGANVTATCSTPEGKESYVFNMPTPLGVATILGHEEVARLLLEGGADKDKMLVLVFDDFDDVSDLRATPLWLTVGLNVGEYAMRYQIMFVFSSAPPKHSHSIMPRHASEAHRCGGGAVFLKNNSAAVAIIRRARPRWRGHDAITAGRGSGHRVEV